MASNSHLPMHFSAGVRTALFSPLLSSTEQRKRRGTDYSRPLAFGLQDTGTDFSRFQQKKLVPYRQPELSKVQKNLYLTGSPKCQNLYLIGSLFWYLIVRTHCTHLLPFLVVQTLSAPSKNQNIAKLAISIDL